MFLNKTLLDVFFGMSQAVHYYPLCAQTVSTSHAHELSSNVTFVMNGREQLHRKVVMDANLSSAEYNDALNTPRASPMHSHSNSFYRQKAEMWEHGPNGEKLRSMKFSPWRVSSCAKGMPHYWAPCINITGVETLYAEEVVYPPHKVCLYVRTRPSCWDPVIVSKMNHDGWSHLVYSYNFSQYGDWCKEHSKSLQAFSLQGPQNVFLAMHAHNEVCQQGYQA